jgi:phosphate transport system substrate-binding protein
MKTVWNYSGRFIRLTCAILLLIHYGCENEPSKGPDRINLDTITIENYPSVDGSTSAHPLQTLIACKILDVEYSWMEWWFDETYRIWPANDKNPECAQYIIDEIVHNGTHGAYVNLITGKADMVLVARKASGDEIELADSAGVDLVTTPVALDAFVFIVNKNNPVNSLTVNEIQDVYTGSIIQWDELGGREAEIHPYQRNENSGSQELMLSLVMKDLEMMDWPEMILFGMMGPINQISHDWDGLGYTVYFFENFMAPNDNLKLLAVNGTEPGYQTLRSKEYIYTTEVYAVIRGDLDASSPAYLLYRWLQTDEGQDVVEESGYIPYY